MKIAVAGTGYVGLSIATLLSQKNEVVAVDVIPEKVEKINRRESPIQDEYIEKYLKEKPLNLTARPWTAAPRTATPTSSSSPPPRTTTPRRTSSTPPMWKRSSTWSWR